jgi:hypothetical protein
MRKSVVRGTASVFPPKAHWTQSKILYMECPNCHEDPKPASRSEQGHSIFTSDDMLSADPCTSSVTVVDGTVVSSITSTGVPAVATCVLVNGHGK